MRVSEQRGDLRELLEALEPWKCCGAPAICGAACQDDELSYTLGNAYAVVKKEVGVGENHG